MPIPQTAKPLPRVSAKENVFSTVQDWIISGTLRPGEKIVDTELAKIFSVSRTPVREALQMLSEQGLVEVIPSRGTRVAEINLEDARQTYELLTELECTAVRLAFPHLDDDDLRALKDLNLHFLDTVEHGYIQEQCVSDMAFHDYIIDRAGNQYLRQYISQLLVRSTRIENLYFGEDIQQKISVEQHDKIIEGLAIRDLSLAEKFMRENWLVSYTRAQDIYSNLEKKSQ